MITAFFQDGRLVRNAGPGVIGAVIVVATRDPDTIHHFEEADYQELEVPFFERELWMGHLKALHVFPDPRSSLSSTSRAVYLARSMDKSLGYLLQILPPWSRTSRHHHKGKTERFIGLAGSCLLGLRDGYVDGTLADHTVGPNTSHHLAALDRPALNLLVIQGPQDPLSMDDHHYEPMPLWANIGSR